MKVICNSIGTTELCSGCGARKLHDGSFCEPCPGNPEAKCVDPTSDEYIDDKQLWAHIEHEDESNNPTSGI